LGQAAGERYFYGLSALTNFAYHFLPCLTRFSA
jgi:hypothetical protein